MRRQSVAALAAVLAVAAWLPAEAAAQQSTQLRGVWTLDAGRSDDVPAKIVDATRGMNRIVGPVARRRLRATNTPYAWVRITPGETVRVDMAGRPSVSSPANGQPVLWNRDTGAACTRVGEDCMRVTTEWQNGRLVQTFRPEDGERRNVYSVSADGNTMTMAVTVSSPRLPRPLTYNLVYRRGS